MSNDFFDGPSRSSYLLKLAMAALTVLALIVAWYARSGASDLSAELEGKNTALSGDIAGLEQQLATAQSELEAQTTAKMSY